MFRVPSLGRVRHGRTNLTAALLLLMILGGFSGFAGVPLAASSHGTASHLAPSAGAAVHTAPPAAVVKSPTAHPGAVQSAPVHPAGTPTASVPFWGNNTAFANSNYASPLGCNSMNYSYGGLYNYSYNYCYSDAIDPTILHLGNGNLGVSYDVDTGSAPITCLSAIGVNLTSRVQFSISTDGGVTFGAAHDLGNSSSCAFPNAIEPSFTVASDGTVYGVYVENNYSGAQHMYQDRSLDVLGFTASSNNGVTFTAPVAIAAGNVARPQVTTFGSSVYVLYENIANWTNTTICYGSGQCGAYPVSTDVLYSSDGGATWSGPYILPGQNGTNGFTTFGAWLQVNQAGTLGVSYFTNQQCVAAPYGYCYNYGADLVWSTSSNNGSTWTAPVLISAAVGEEYYVAGTQMYGFYEIVPASQFVFSSDGLTAYVVWDGTFSKNSYYYYSYYNAGIFEATGPTSGTGWVTQSIEKLTSTNNNDDIFHPAIGWVGGSLYMTFTWFNSTYCYGICPPTDYTMSQWQASSTDGAAWTSPAEVDQVYPNSMCTYVWCQSTYYGERNSVGSLNASYPVFGFTLGAAQQQSFNFQPTGAGYNYWINYSYQDRLEVAFPYSGPTITVNFTENNLPPGTTWSFSLNGGTVSTSSTSILVTDVPPNQILAINANPVPAGYRTIIAPSSSVGSEVSFAGNASVWFNFSVSYGVQFWINPPDCTDCQIQIYQNGSSTNYYAQVTDCPYSFCMPNFYSSVPFPWYFSAGSTISIHTYSYPTMSAAYWNGTGTGSVTGPSNWANLTIGSPINETVWWGGFGSYSVNVAAIGLPSTSTYSFAFDGVPHSAAGTSSVQIDNVVTGVHTVDGISATSTTSGWEYFGYSTPKSPVLEPAAPNVNLSFAYVNVASTAGTISFHAQGISSGTVWTFSFNGTTYSSNTPWINVTGQSGTYPVGAFPITALNASVGYTPTGVAQTMSVTPGSTYLVQYLQAFKVSAVAGTGGSVTGAGSFWVAGGSMMSFHATVHANYGFGGWTGTGLGSYTGSNSYANITANGPIEETAVFFPQTTARFNLTVSETGIPAGTIWTVFLGNVGYSSNLSAFQITNLYACGNPLGNYNLTVPYAYASDGLTRYVPTSHLSRTICTTGSTTLADVFAPQYFLSLASTVGGYATASVGTTSTTSSLWAPDGAPVSLSAFALTGYQFLGWNGTGPGSYTGAGLQWSIAISGPVTELAVFARPVTPPTPLFGLTFQLAAGAVAAGTTWTVTVGGVGYSSSTTSLLVPGLPAGTYTLSVATVLSPDGLTRYTPLAVQPSITVSHNATYPVSFSSSYWVSISSTPGGTTLPASGWVVAGSTVLLNASASDGYVFIGWAGTGSAGWSGTDSNHTLVVTSPVTEVATFRAVQVTIGSSGGTNSIFSEPWLWAVFGVIGLVVGLLVGMILSRRGRTPPPMTSTSTSEDPSASDAPSSPGGSQ